MSASSVGTTAPTTTGAVGFSMRLRASVADQWDYAVGSRFVDELLAGTVADEVLTRYLVQDYQFCDAFTALLGAATATAPNLADRLMFARQLGFFASDENDYFQRSFDALGVPERDRLAPDLAIATRAFDAVMRRAADSRSYAAALAVLIVAEWLYLDWATRPDADPPACTRPEHLEWVDLHRGAEFTAWVDWLRSRLDAHEPTDPDEHALVTRLFQQAVRAEWGFFDAPYPGSFGGRTDEGID